MVGIVIRTCVFIEWSTVSGSLIGNTIKLSAELGDHATQNKSRTTTRPDWKEEPVDNIDGYLSLLEHWKQRTDRSPTRTKVCGRYFQEHLKV